MCLFCAAIPSVLALGAAAHGKQREAARRAEVERGAEPAPAPGRAERAVSGRPARVPVAKVTTALVVVLVIASAVYHTQPPA